MQVVVLGAWGGLGRNVVDAAQAAGHEVRALIREAARGDLPADVQIVTGDAHNVADVQRSLAGAGAAFFCVNPRFSRWLDDFPPLLDAAIEACRAARVRLVFPANVWIYGPGRPEQEIDELQPATPTSKRGMLRARMEAKLRTSGARYCMVRLPEFYGPHVVSLTARVFQNTIREEKVLWPGPLDATVEFGYMPDAATALVEAGCADGTDGETFHVPGGRTTPRRFIRTVGEAAGTIPKTLSVPPIMLRTLGLFDPSIAVASDTAHLWTDPVLLDGGKYRQRFGSVPVTPLSQALPDTLKWYRAHPNLKLQS